VIVGGGMAGAKAAEALREHGFDGRIVLVGAETEPPYERPPLSKDHLRGESPLEKAHVHPAGFYDEHGIELRLGVRATAIDPRERTVALDDGTALAYDRLLLATGAVPRRPPIPGAADLEGVHLLRSAADAAALRDAISAGGPLVIVGGGWIGCEVAASARQMGADVDLVEMAQTPLAAVLGTELGQWFAALHRGHGVRLHLGAAVDRLEGDGRVERVVLGDGTRIDAAAVLLGVGVAPDTALATAAGLDVDNGITCDELLRTSAPDVYAAGDVAAAWHPRYERHVRVEHWSTALNQGTAAGVSMAGHGTPYDRLPYFFSDQYDAGLEYVGLHAPEDRLVIRGSLQDDAFRAIWVGADDRVTAGMHVNDWDAIGPLRELVESRAVLEPETLA
jgi:3-phenylpropionate/trans-cinnamate dioxygenase ferredoxin reductase subunit